MMPGMSARSQLSSRSADMPRPTQLLTSNTRLSVPSQPNNPTTNSCCNTINTSASAGTSIARANATTTTTDAAIDTARAADLNRQSLLALAGVAEQRERHGDGAIALAQAQPRDHLCGVGPPAAGGARRAGGARVAPAAGRTACYGRTCYGEHVTANMLWR